MFRPTVRLRLTLAYGGLFLLAGAILLSLNYVLVERSISERRGFALPLERELGLPAEGVVVIREEVPPGLDPANATFEEAIPVTDVLRDFRGRLREKTLDELVLQSLLALGVMAVASVGLGWVVAGRALQPVHDITAAARRISETKLHERIGLQGPEDELKELADTFDSMLGRLDAAFDAQRRFVANASHELRTPLSIMRTEIDVTLADPDASAEELRTMAETVRDATVRSDRLIDSLLLLARTDRGLDRRDPMDLADVATDVVDHLRSAAGAVAVRIDTDLQPLPVTGDRHLLERLVANLVENGIYYNVASGWVSVATAGGRLTVANSGPAVPADQVASLFEPFRRLDADRTGSARSAGLGLSIVRSIAAAHGGTAHAVPREGGGLVVTVELWSENVA